MVGVAGVGIGDLMQEFLFFMLSLPMPPPERAT